MALARAVTALQKRFPTPDGRFMAIRLSMSVALNLRALLLTAPKTSQTQPALAQGAQLRRILATAARSKRSSAAGRWAAEGAVGGHDSEITGQRPTFPAVHKEVVHKH